MTLGMRRTVLVLAFRGCYASCSTRSENRQTSSCASPTVRWMNLSPPVCYRAVLARDARYDGRFFTCVETTGIYCRPICPARPPKLENCRFVPTAAAAQEAGFRPCLRCRPESSPDLNAWRGTSATVSRALKLIESGALDDGDLASLADRLEIGERQLRRLFRRHVGAAPDITSLPVCTPGYTLSEW